MFYQNVETIRSGGRCQIIVGNHSGDDTLTTYDPGTETVELAAQELADFFNQCVAEFEGRGSGHRPRLYGQLATNPPGNMDLLPVMADGRFCANSIDLNLYTEILVQPVPLAGG